MSRGFNISTAFEFGFEFYSDDFFFVRKTNGMAIGPKKAPMIVQNRVLAPLFSAICQRMIADRTHTMEMTTAPTIVLPQPNGWKKKMSKKLDVYQKKAGSPERYVGNPCVLRIISLKVTKESSLRCHRMTNLRKMHRYSAHQDRQWYRFPNRRHLSRDRHRSASA